MRKIVCTWVNSKLKEEKDFVLCLNNNNTVGDLLKKALKLVKLSGNGSGKLRLLGIIAHKIFIVFKEDVTIGALAKFKRITLRIEEIPCDQMNIAENELLIPVGHYDKHPFSPHGVPFLLKVKDKEPFWKVRRKIKEKLEVTDEEIEKYEFAIIIIAEPFPIQDNDYIDLMDFSPNKMLGEIVGGRTWLGMNHPASYVKESHTTKPITCYYFNNKFEEKKMVLHLRTNGTVADLLNEAMKFVDLPENSSRKLRLLGLYGNRIQSLIKEDVSLERLIASGWKTLRVEEIPIDEINMARDELLISVAHYQKVVSALFGVPFLIKAKQKEQFYRIKKRIKEKLQVSDEDFKKYKFSLNGMGTIRYLNNRQSLPNFSQLLDSGEKFLHTIWIGMDHNPEVNVIKCTWVNSKLEERELILQLNKNGTVSDLLEEAKKKVTLSEDGSGKLRLLDTSDHNIYSIIKEDMSTEALYNDGWRHLRVEEIPNDQINIGKDELLVTVVQYKWKFKHFGVPFLLKIKENEVVRRIRERIRIILGMDYIKFRKCEIELRSFGMPRTLEDTDRIEMSDLYQHLVPGEHFHRTFWIGVNCDNLIKGLDLKLFPCSWYDTKGNRKENLLLLLRDDSTVADLLDEAEEKINFLKNESKSCRRLRLLFTYGHRLFYMMNKDMPLFDLYSFGVKSFGGSLIIEEMSYEEEKRVLIPVSDFQSVIDHISKWDLPFLCAFVNDKFEYKKYLTLYLEETNTVADLLKEARKQVELSENGSGKLRLVDTIRFQNFSVIRAFWPLQTLQAGRFKAQCLRIEEIPKDELKIAKDELLISVGHYQKEVSHTFGMPFLLKVKDKERFFRVRKRIQKKLRVTNEEFKMYKFALIVDGKPRPLQNTSCINLSDFKIRVSPDGKPIPWTWLGLDHPKPIDNLKFCLSLDAWKPLQRMMEIN